jgi:hypothetical protein
MSGLVNNVECIPKCPVELRAFDVVESSNSKFVEVFEGHGKHVVAVDHTGFRKSLVWADFHF